MQLSKYTIGYLIALALATISLFMPWVDIGILSVNGFQQQGWLVLIPLLYPATSYFTGRGKNKIINLVLGILCTLFMFGFINSKDTALGINAATTGMYVMAFACITVVGTVIFEILSNRYQ